MTRDRVRESVTVVGVLYSILRHGGTDKYIRRDGFPVQANRDEERRTGQDV